MKSMWNLVPQPLKALNFHNHIAYGHQNRQDGELPSNPIPMKLFYSLVTWLCKVTWQTKTIISPQSQCLWPPNLAEWWLISSNINDVIRAVLNLFNFFTKRFHLHKTQHTTKQKRKRHKDAQAKAQRRK